MTVKSAKGEIVDFDLLKIKQQIADAPLSTKVAARQNFVDNKFKRRIKRTIQEVKSVEEAPEVVESSSEEPVVTTSKTKEIK
jgi:hypothetical protein